MGSKLTARKESPIKRGLEFIAESRNELRKVTWPTRKETMGITSVVIISVFIAGFYLATVDWGLSQIIKNLIR